ncbi:MAG TPA: GFA family protein [Caulobacteraceae bacterium]|nr:GFA family protein [Caulobacteraceae bacterium]
MIEATCHCGAVKVQAPRAPETVTDCNCSICRRLGTLWAYYDSAEVAMETSDQALETYVRGDPAGSGELSFRRCRICGCTVDWRPREGRDQNRMGINARLFDPAVLEGAKVRKLDGASWVKHA